MIKRKKKKESSIFKRRINYSHFINQKKKQNIILRNQELCFKQNKINNSNNSNGANKTKIGIENNYCNIYYSKENNNKIKSLDKSAKKINNLNCMINNNINHRNNNKNEFYDKFQNDEFYKNYFLSENREYAHVDNK